MINSRQIASSCQGEGAETVQPTVEDDDELHQWEQKFGPNGYEKKRKDRGRQQGTAGIRSHHQEKAGAAKGDSTRVSKKHITDSIVAHNDIWYLFFYGSTVVRFLRPVT